MRIAVVLAVVGRLARIFALTFLIPLVFALVDRQPVTARHFAIALVITMGAGTLMGRLAVIPKALWRAEALAVVSGAWLVCAVFGGLPYLLAGLSPVDALFEAMSGLTTTGATILTDFGAFDRAMYLWRAMTQWFGGLGVIALFVVVLPRLGIAGRQLLFAEASGAPSEGVSPHVGSAARRLWMLYMGLTALLAGLLCWQGFDLYDGVVHALTTLSAGGFSPNGRSIEGFANPGVEWVLVVFMTLAGASYALQWRALTRGPRELLRDGELLLYLLGMGVLTVVLAGMLAGGVPGEEAWRTSAFQITSLASSTGYASADYALWGASPKAILIVAMLFGGCAGSACGGPKVVRWLLLGRFLKREANQTLHPRGVIPLRYKGRSITTPILRSVLMVIFLYALTFVGLGLLLAALGEANLELAFTASLACVGNVGPAFGDAGPMGSFAGFSDGAKSLLVLGMWMGRLEILTILALLHADVWRGSRWGGRRRADAGGSVQAPPHRAP